MKVNTLDTTKHDDRKHIDIPASNIPIPTCDCNAYQIACLCGIECPKFIEAYELGVRDDECAIYDENVEEIKKTLNYE